MEIRHVNVQAQEYTRINATWMAWHGRASKFVCAIVFNSQCSLFNLCTDSSECIWAIHY